MNKKSSPQQTIGIKPFFQLFTEYTVPLLTAILFVVFNSPLLADNLSDTDKYAWSENTGWLNFKSTHEQVKVYNDHLEGYVWAENVGWIRLGTHTSGDSFTYANNSASNYGVNNDGSGNLSGYGWAENIGWVNFNSTNSQVTIDATTGDFNGYAWSENTGWIHFKNSAPAYKVQRSLSSPAPFSFTDQTNVALSTLISSNSVIITGINSASSLSITGGEYEINGSGTWLTANGSVVNNDTVRVRHTSSASYSTTTNTTLTIGGVSDTFSLTTATATADTIPNSFSFTDQTNVALNTLISSNSVTITGINTASSLSITGGEYEINGSGTWLTTNGSVVNNDTVRVRHTSSASYSTTTNTTLTIGGVSDTFSLTTATAPAGHIIPDAPDGGNTGGTVTFAVPGETLSGITVTLADGNRPTGILSPYGKISYQVTSSTPGGLVTVRLVFSTTLPATLSFYKVDLSGNYSLIPANTGNDGYWTIVDTNTVDMTLRDNGQFDLNNTLGIIDDPIVIAVRAVQTAQPIPTLSFWGVLLLAGILLLFGVRFLAVKSY